MYMGYWDADSRSAKRISRDTEAEYYGMFKQRLPGYYDDAEWWKLVESADQPPVEELPECPSCGAQNLKEAEECVACGEILQGKTCVNGDCKRQIPLSAATCPHCGANQLPIVLEPWLCKVCTNKNVATDDVCRTCGSARGTKHPLSSEVLLACSDKVDSLSCDGLVVKLVDGTNSKPLRVDAYSSQKPMISPVSKEAIPLIVKKEIGKISVFVDFSHPFFTRCALSKQQLIASEIAMYLYDERRNLANYSEHSLSNLTWEILMANWHDSVELSTEGVLQNSTELLTEMASRLRDILGSDASMYFDDLTIEQKKQLTNCLIQHGVDLSKIGELKSTGEYISYAPFSFLLTIFRESPDTYFGDSGIWKVSLACGGEELLGPENVAQAREKIITQYGNYLQDVINFSENKYTDIITLQRVVLSVEFLRKGLVV